MPALVLASLNLISFATAQDTKDGTEILFCSGGYADATVVLRERRKKELRLAPSVPYGGGGECLGKLGNAVLTRPIRLFAARARKVR